MVLMRSKSFLIVLLAVVLSATLSCRKATQQQIVQRELIYKTLGKTQLKLHIFESAERKSDSLLPAIVLLHGGGWFAGSPDSFFQHCRYFASRGMVAISAQYRFNVDAETPPYECLEDAKSAIRYVRANAKALGIDTEKIAVAGASAGGHLAVAAVLFEDYNAENEDKNISTTPAALILFSSAFDTTENGTAAWILEKYNDKLTWVLGPKAEELSLTHHIKGGLPPCIILHGAKDDIVPLEAAERFCKLMTEAGNDCKLVTFEDSGHDFFLYKEDEQDNKAFEKANHTAEEFLRSLGLLNQ